MLSWQNYVEIPPILGISLWWVARSVAAGFPREGKRLNQLSHGKNSHGDYKVYKQTNK